MKDYNIEKKYRIYSKTTTQGTQEKYLKNEYYYKINSIGNEGLVEYLVSVILKHSNLSKNMYIPYEYCKINGKLGCRSYNFLLPNEEFITMNSLYKKVTGKNNLSDYLMYLGSASKRLEYLLDIAKICGICTQDFRNYLNILIQLDLLIQNTDRHVHNYGVIYNNEKLNFRIPPIFDNGHSLNTDASKSEVSCTISGSFEEQIIAFGYPIQPIFQLNYEKLFKELDNIRLIYGNTRELNVLYERLYKYQNIFKVT